MKTYPLRKLAAALFCFGTANFAIALDDTTSVVTAVFSRSLNDYQRPVRGDGSSQPLTYVVAKGGPAVGRDADDSIDDVRFAGIVRVLGKHLAKQAYFPAKDGKKADLMLVVHWGKTVPGDGMNQNLLDQGLQGFTLSHQLGFGIGESSRLDAASRLPPSIGASTKAANDAAVAGAATNEMMHGLFLIRFAEDARVEANRRNANLLGYTAELKRRDNPSLFAGAGTAYHDLIADLESERYYMSVTAYDFQEMLHHDKKKGLWRTVVSIDARGNRFDERLMAMVERASRYFGQDSGRLIRQFEYTPHIDLGELKTLGVVDKEPRRGK